MPENTEDVKEEFTPITTQEDLDKIIGKRVMRERDKYKDYDKYKSAAEELDKIKEANKSDLEKATSRAEKAEKELASLKSAQELSKAAKEIAKETGVPAEALRGSTREELAEHAAQLQTLLHKGSIPYVDSDGKKPSSGAAKSNAQVFAELFN